MDEQWWLKQIKIRRLRETDLLALEWGGEFLQFRRLYRDIFSSMLKGRAVMWIAEVPDLELIGQLFVQLTSSRKEIADGASRAYFYGFRVKKSYRSCGVGSRLLEIAEEDLISRGFQQALLNVAKTNSLARQFYEKHGYQVVGEEPGDWTFLDHEGRRKEVHEPAWRMEKGLQ